MVLLAITRSPCALDLHWRGNSRRGPMTGSGVTRLFVVGERLTTPSLSSGAHSRDPLANPPCGLKLSFDSRLVDDRPYFYNLFVAKFIDHVLGKGNSLTVDMEAKERSLWRTVEA
jgi:hypothetical protein